MLLAGTLVVIIFSVGYISDKSIAEEDDEGEVYDDVDEDLIAQILSRNEAKQKKETAVEEGSKKAH